MARSNRAAPLVFISVAEQSADLHGAALIRATRESLPDVRFVGVAGPEMVKAGCDGIFDMTRHAAMLLGALGSVRQGLRMLRTADEHLRRYAFDAAVVVDSPILNLRIARRAHALGVPVLYYIAPQLWAWGARRIYKLRHDVDHVACILPFEESYFRDQGVNATFVGHPLAERFAESVSDDRAIAELRGKGTPLVAILPGSRRHVVESNLPGQLAVARQICAKLPRAKFIVSIANERVGPDVRRMAHSTGLPVSTTDKHHDLVRAADLVLVTSGTAALEVAFLERPMIVMYQASRLFYHLFARWMLTTKYLSLPNILAGREIVPEFMPYYSSTDAIAEQAISLLADEPKRATMVTEMRNIVAPLRRIMASRRTAHLLLALIESHRH
jgi:lipid-A-disaccharide synthase